MNRTGLKIALAIGFAVGLICAVDPQLDLDLSALSFDSKVQMFEVNAQMWVQHARNAARLVITFLVLPGFVAIWASSSGRAAAWRSKAAPPCS